MKHATYTLAKASEKVLLNLAIMQRLGPYSLHQTPLPKAHLSLVGRSRGGPWGSPLLPPSGFLYQFHYKLCSIAQICATGKFFSGPTKGGLKSGPVSGYI